MITSFEQLYPILSQDSPALIELKQVLKRQKFPANTILTAAGEVSDKLYYVEKGLVRAYYYNDNDNDNDNEITSWIVAEGHWATVTHSFFDRTPAQETMQVLEPSILYCIDYHDLQRLYAESPVVNQIGRLITEQYLLHYDLRLRTLRMTTAEQRMAFFEKHYKPLLNRAMGKHIASFLGITPQTYSRLRSKRLRP